MLIKIKNRNGRIILSGEYTSINECLEKNISANLSGADLSGANLRGADLSGADLSGANLSGADLSGADLRGADLRGANLISADLINADLRGANLISANLRGANLISADLINADLRGANLSGANLRGANLSGAKGLIKIMGVEPGNYYWKAISENMKNNGYEFKLGLNKLYKGEVFADDERVLCSFPGFHFASKSWCKREYGNRKYLCKIRIPMDAKINEPWATDGKASANKIEIISIYLMDSGKNVTYRFRKRR